MHDFIDSGCGSVFTFQFWSLWCYFLDINQRLFLDFNLKIDSQTERWNNSIKPYLGAFVNYKQVDLVKLLPILKFTYNNTKYASIRNMPFKPNCRYHPLIFFWEDIYFSSRPKVAIMLTEDLTNIVVVYQKKLANAQKLQKWTSNKATKPRSYVLGEKVWLNSKYIKIICHQQLKATIFRSFGLLIGWISQPTNLNFLSRR